MSSRNRRILDQVEDDDTYESLRFVRKLRFIFGLATVLMFSGGLWPAGICGIVGFVLVHLWFRWLVKSDDSEKSGVTG